jgi:hypothetical protein
MRPRRAKLREIHAGVRRMSPDKATAIGPVLLWPLVLHTVASFWHFAHNATYVDAYPNLPASLSAGRIWLAWAALASLGVAGCCLLRLGRSWLGLSLIGMYGLLGFDGLAHYALAPLSAHTLTMNLTIWGEAVAAAILVIATVRCIRELLTVRPEGGASFRGLWPGED